MAFNCRFFTKLMCAIGQIAMAGIILGQMPNGSSAFAPSLNTQRTVGINQLRQFNTVPIVDTSTTSNHGPTPLKMSQENEPAIKSSLPVFLDPGTKGGAVVLSVLLFVLPLILYQVVTKVMGVDEIEAGRDIGVGFSVVTMLLWGSTYIFRVATKDMTYVRKTFCDVTFLLAFCNIFSFLWLWLYIYYLVF